jgi:hypothetical protein
MANLRGGNFDKQIRNALMRMEKFGQSRHNTESRGIHSEAVFKKREMYLNDFKKFAENNNLTDKLNALMTPENISNFLNSRLENKAANTSENFVRGFSAMVDDLRNNNIDISVDKNLFNEKVLEIKNNDNSEVRLNRAVANPNTVIANLYDKHYHSGVMAETTLETSFRLSETIELTSNLDKYLDRDTNIISGIIGKGGQEYQPKEISPALIAKIDAIDKHISKSTYAVDLKNQGLTPHDFRYSFASNTYREQIEEGKSQQEALLFTSKEMNHHRAEITKYYLSKA